MTLRSLVTTLVAAAALALPGTALADEWGSVDGDVDIMISGGGEGVCTTTSEFDPADPVDEDCADAFDPDLVDIYIPGLEYVPGST